MKVYAVHYDKFVDEEYESGILDDVCFTNEMEANTKMLKEAQYAVDDWNRSPPSEFKLDLYPDVKMCSVSAQFESDYYNLAIVEMEVK